MYTMSVFQNKTYLSQMQCNKTNYHSKENIPIEIYRYKYRAQFPPAEKSDIHMYTMPAFQYKTYLSQMQCNKTNYYRET